MFRINKKTVIYIFCPAEAITGGPEALHQLCDAINMQGGKARMVYVDYGTEVIVPSGKPLPYRTYYTGNTMRVVDDSSNIAIVPEIWAHLLDGYRHLQKALWWLSVNYLRTQEIFEKKEFFHLYQSTYAGHFLHTKGIGDALPLFDYLNIPFRKSRMSGRRPQVCYNPKKGYEVTEKIMSSMGNGGIAFIALRGLSKKEMARVLSESKVYIDFGDHPGKDRIPREAVMAGNIVITSREGSAAFFEDLPIPEKYRIQREDIDGICDAIKTAIDGYEMAKNDFDYYRRVVRVQKREFFNQAAVLFVGENSRAGRKFTGWLIYRILPLRSIYLNLEWLKNKVIKLLSPSAKRTIKKVIRSHQ